MIDSATLRGPASKRTRCRVHCTFDLLASNGDWHESRVPRAGERLSRAPVKAGHALLGNRTSLDPRAIRTRGPRGRLRRHLLVPETSADAERALPSFRRNPGTLVGPTAYRANVHYERSVVAGELGANELPSHHYRVTDKVGIGQPVSS